MAGEKFEFILYGLQGSGRGGIYRGGGPRVRGGCVWAFLCVYVCAGKGLPVRVSFFQRHPFCWGACPFCWGAFPPFLRLGPKKAWTRRKGSGQHLFERNAQPRGLGKKRLGLTELRSVILKRPVSVDRYTPVSSTVSEVSSLPFYPPPRAP